MNPATIRLIWYFLLQAINKVWRWETQKEERFYLRTFVQRVEPIAVLCERLGVNTICKC